ncbi:MAG TPA: DUF4129 domain-containing protein [Pedococcus sp.]
MSVRVAVAALPGRLDPGNTEARQWLRDELAKAAYRDTRDPLQRAVDAVTDWLARLLSGAHGPTRPLPTIVAAVVAVGLVALVAYMLRFVRRTARMQGSGPDTVLGDQRLSAADLRARSDRAFSERRYAACLLDAVRAIARGGVERALLEDAPSLTAHEIADRLAASFPTWAQDLRWAAGRFDAVAYGDASASREDATQVLQLEASLRRARPASPTGDGVDGASRQPVGTTR